jgi:hypothetical protein
LTLLTSAPHLGLPQIVEGFCSFPQTGQFTARVRLLHAERQPLIAVYKGKIRLWGKTRKSLGSVHVPKELADDLWLWKQRCPNPSSDAFIFPNKKGGLMDSNNYGIGFCTDWRRNLSCPS